MNVTVTWTGMDRYRAAATRFAVMLPANINGAVRDATEEMADNIRTAASGRPGPNIRTGALWSSITPHYGLTGPDVFQAGMVTTDIIYARRIEYGWYGTDSIGRSLPTRPYPFWGPGFNRASGNFPRRLQQAIAASG